MKQTVFKKFISFEGIDLSGKSTQISILMKKLSEIGIKPLLVREPGGTEISEKIREILLNPVNEEMHEITEILLYEAARAQLVHQKILPWLKQGQYVIADRFFDSTTCYQGYGRKLDLEVVNTLNTFATSGLKPYRTFFLDISTQVAENRRLAAGKTKDRLESGGIQFFEQIRNGFLDLCKKEPDRFVRIDGNRDHQTVADDIWSNLSEIWNIQSE